METRPEDLHRTLQQGLAPVYLLSGDEPLQMMEAADAIRAAARGQGFDERQVFHVDASFDWGALAGEADALSLFASRRILDVRMPKPSPGVDGAKALATYAERPPEDTVLLISTGRMDKRAMGGKWVKAIDAAGVVVRIWPVELKALPGWVGRRLREAGMQPEPDVVQLLVERVEGNLLAAAQEVSKLALLCGPGAVSLEQARAAVADSSRFDPYDLVNAALNGQAARAVHVLEGLRGEGVSEVFITWVLADGVRKLGLLAAARDQGQALDRVLREQRLFTQRAAPYRAALRHVRAAGLLTIQRACARADRIAKGAETGEPWTQLLEVSVALSQLCSGQRMARRIMANSA
ncbi:MAG: DNA polymerase III subunit delta [Gammaproteobacteria bacterium]